MHGQARDEYKERQTNPEVAAALEKKALQWNTLLGELLNRREKDSTTPTVAAFIETKIEATANDGTSGDLLKEHKQTLELNSKLLLVNPDPMVLWNIRRELLLKNLLVIEDELDLTAQCLRKNPKAYGTWLHRKWAIQVMISMMKQQANYTTYSGSNLHVLLEIELGLCKKFLDLDERNFHCWNYRRFVVSAIATATSIESARNDENIQDNQPTLVDGSWKWVDSNNSIMGPQIATAKSTPTPPSTLEEDFPKEMKNSLHHECMKKILEKEWEYTTEKIYKNFSNYSAFHYRSKLIPLMIESQFSAETCTASERYKKILGLAREELELLQQAVFTEPDDQTAWWYHRFIVASFMEPLPELSWEESVEDVEPYMELLQEEADNMRELIEAEDRQCKWGLLALYMLLGKLISASKKLGLEDENDLDGWNMECNECLDTLIEIDPDRVNRYESMKS